MPEIRLIDVQDNADAPAFLWELLRERTPEVSISHHHMPTMRSHLDFIESIPYRAWSIIVDQDTGEWVGQVSLTHRNEIGVQIARKYHRHGYATAAVQRITTVYSPLDGRPGEIGQGYVANINPANAPSIALFKKLGAIQLQVTYKLP